MKTVFCGNFEYETHQTDFERLFSKYGPVERVDKKSGFAVMKIKTPTQRRNQEQGTDGGSPFQPIQPTTVRGGVASSGSPEQPIKTTYTQDKAVNLLFVNRQMQFGIGGTLPPKKDLHRGQEVEESQIAPTMAFSIVLALGHGLLKLDLRNSNSLTSLCTEHVKLM